jgi:hypothetical protein
MAEGDITLFQAGIGAIGNGDIDLTSSDTHAITIILMTSDYTPNQDTDLVYGDISANEYGSSDGYTAGGAVLQTTTWSYDSDNVRWSFDAADLTWSSLGPLETPTPGYAVAYENGAAASDDHLLFYMELGTTATNGGDYTLTWGATVFNSS